MTHPTSAALLLAWPLACGQVWAAPAQVGLPPGAGDDPDDDPDDGGKKKLPPYLRVVK